MNKNTHQHTLTSLPFTGGTLWGIEPENLGVPSLCAYHYNVGLGKDKTPTFRLPDTEIYGIMGDHYDKQKIKTMYCNLSTTFLF